MNFKRNTKQITINIKSLKKINKASGPHTRWNSGKDERVKPFQGTKREGGKKGRKVEGGWLETMEGRNDRLIGDDSNQTPPLRVQSH